MTDPSYGTRAASSRRFPRPLRSWSCRRRGHPDEVAARPKVLHGFAGRSLLGHVLAASAPLDAERTIVVVGHRPRRGRRPTLTEIAPAASTRSSRTSSTAPATRCGSRWTPCRRRTRRHDRRGARATPRCYSRRACWPCSLSTHRSRRRRDHADQRARRPDRLRPGDPRRRRTGRRGSSSRRTPPTTNSPFARSRPASTPSTTRCCATRSAGCRPTTPRARSTCPTSSAILVGDGRRVAAVDRAGDRDRRRQRSRPARRGAPDLQPPAARRAHARRRHRGRPGDHLDRRRRRASSRT